VSWHKYFIQKLKNGIIDSTQRPRQPLLILTLQHTAAFEEDGIPFKLKDYLELVDWAARDWLNSADFSPLRLNTSICHSHPSNSQRFGYFRDWNEQWVD